MGEKILTVWWGMHGVSITNSDFPREGMYKGVTRITDYPMNPIKSIFARKRTNSPIAGNLPPEVFFDERPMIDPFTGEYKEKKIRLVFMDLFGNIDVKTGEQIPAIVSQQRKLANAEAVSNELALKLLNTWEHFGYKMEDEKTKELLRTLNVSKEAKSKLFSIIDYNKGGQNK
jgi:hypothetical protein